MAAASSSQEENTEDVILAAAKSVFVRKGFAGARMQEIADEAGINKAMLHYYFRNKEKLFHKILGEAMEKLSPHFMKILGGEGSVLEKLDRIVEVYVGLNLSEPYLPMFVMHELSQNRGKFLVELRERNQDPDAIAFFFRQVQEEIAAKQIRPINPIHLIMNVMSLSVFPFISMPVVMTLAKMEEDDFQLLLEERIDHVKQFLRAALQP